MKNLINWIGLSAIILCFSAACSPDVVTYDSAAKPQFEMSAATAERDEPVTFTDKSTPTTGTTIVGWKWNFDFGNAENTEFSTEKNPVYAFRKTGTFTVMLTVTDSQGRSASTSQSIVIQTPYDEMAHADFVLDGEKFNLNTPVEFKDNSVPASGATIVNYDWSFGESEDAVSSEQNPEWTYTTSGSFTVTLTITDSKGNTDTKSRDLIIIDPEDLIVIDWKSPVMGAIQNSVSPALSADGQTAYMWADQSGNNTYDVALKAYNMATGTVSWSFNVNDAFAELTAGAGVRLVYTSPSVGSNGDIYVCARDLKNSGAARKSYLIAIKPDGTKHWHYSFGLDANFNYLTPAIDADGKIYVGHLSTAPYEIAILNPTTGAKEKSISLSVGVRPGISLDKNGNVYFCSTGANGMYSYTQAGAQNWQYNTDFVTTGGSISIGADGTVYTVSEGASKGLIVAVAANGSKKWAYETPNVIQFGGVVLGADGTVYASGGKVAAGKASAGIYALKADGTLKWHFPTTEDVNNCVPLVDNRGYIHFITDKGTYYVVTDAGALFAKKSIGDKSFASPVMNAEGKVCIAAETAGASFIYSLDTEAEGYAASAWPMKGQNPQRTHLQK